MPDVGRPSPEEYQPPLAWWSHAWRVVAMVAISALAWVGMADTPGGVVIAFDVAIGVLALGLTVLRRRWPLTIAVVTAALSSVSASAAGPSALAAVSLATRRRWTHVLVVAVVNVAGGLLYQSVHPPEQQQDWWVELTTTVIAIAALLGWGMYLGSRRELLWTLRARAERAEAEQELRAGQSRLEERSRIAREMHDVLAHRISQISMRAGAMSYRDDLGADELREGVTVIRDAANQALTDLRGVLGVLRDGEVGPDHAPQPTYVDVAGLVDEARRTGLRVAYDDGLAGAAVPDATGRTLYRIVQEGLTNARKHAPGAEVTVAVHGSADDGIEVVISNPLGFGPTVTPGSGLGLVGVAERAALRGGRVEHGAVDGAFVLRGWIPWAA